MYSLERYCNYGQENRKCQSPQSDVNFEQRARRTTSNKARESGKRHPNTTPSQSHFLRQGITARQSCKVDCQLDSIRGEYRGRREACQIKFDKRVLSGHRCNPEHPDRSRYCASGIGEGTKHSGKRQKSSQQYSMENQQCSQSPMLPFVFGYPNNYPQYNDENRNRDQRSDPTKPPVMLAAAMFPVMCAINNPPSARNPIMSTAPAVMLKTATNSQSNACCGGCSSAN